MYKKLLENLLKFRFNHLIMIQFDIKAISLHPDLTLSSHSFFKKMKRHLEKNCIPFQVYASFNIPLVFVHKNQHQLISHHFIYMLVKSLKFF